MNEEINKILKTLSEACHLRPHLLILDLRAMVLEAICKYLPKRKNLPKFVFCPK